MENLNIETLQSEPDRNIVKTLSEAYEKGISVIPVNENKTPLLKWKEYQQRKPTRQELITWEEQAEGIAIVTGKINDLIVLDVDMKKTNGLESLKGKHLPVTPVVRTKNGGFHYYFKYPSKAKKVKTAADILPAVDIRGDGGYAVIPYTNGYEWVEGLSVNDIEIAEIPEWLFPHITSNDSKTQRVKQVNEYSFTRYTPLATNKAVNIKGFDRRSLTEWYKQEQAAGTFLELMGINKKIGDSFKCVIPGHDDKTPSASVYQGDNGLFIYRDWHKIDGKEIMFLPEVYAAVHYKRVIELGKPEFSIWAIRLLVDGGLVSPYGIIKKPLPDGVKPTVKKVYDGFCHLLACKWLYNEGDPTPFSWRFASAWCGVSERKAGESIKYLLQHGYIRIVKKERFRGREMALFTIVK
ncbi:MAG TPA: bifunctional DNA primase/polymerase [Bacteroidales bacterium]|nr:bifunctional DNA primase/polymerase [Bacteroidales bacterium]